MVRQLLSGNQFGVLLQINSGLPVNISASRDLNGDGISSDRPLFVARNPLYLAPRKNVDLRYTRFVPIRGSVRAEIVAELKNVFNTEQLAGITTSTVVDALGNPATRDSDRPVSVRQPVGLRAAQVPARVQSPVLEPSLGVMANG